MYLEGSWLFISHFSAFPINNKRFVATPLLYPEHQGKRPFL